MSDVSIDGDRLWETIQVLGRIGATDSGGVTREDGTEADRRARDRVVAWFEDAGLDVRVDPVGNIVGRRDGDGTGRAPVMTGSHIDTPPEGGKFDGVVGVLTPLEIVRSWNEAGIGTDRPVEIVVFTGEELSRFSVGLLGSQVASGLLPIEEALATEDDDGISVGRALEEIGYRGDAALGLERAHAFVELHVEQGPVLDDRDVPVGIVEAITGITGHTVTFTGEANHAGTTPMRLRRDAFMAAAAFATDLESLARELATETTAVSTVGRAEVSPNATNVVPGTVELGVDIRDTDERSLAELLDRAPGFARDAGADRGVEVAWREDYHRPPTPMDAGIVDTLERACDGLGVDSLRMPSGAGHDAMCVAACAPAGMLFVPSRDGVSHSPEEYTEPEDVDTGARVLERSLRELAG